MTRFLALAVVPAVLAAAPAAAHADDLGDSTFVRRGMSELDASALGILSYASSNGMSTTDASIYGAARFQHFTHDHLSLGVEGIIGYEHAPNGIDTTSLGGTLLATYHARLGVAAFLRPTLGLGYIHGSSSVATGVNGLSLDSSSNSFVTRVQLPFAYFATDSLVLQAGPEIDFVFGSQDEGGGDSQGFTRIIGGFSVSIGVTL